MKEFACLLATILSLVWSAPASPVAPPNLRLNYIHPERFTDFRLQGRSESESVRIFSDSISPALSRELGRRLPGARLSLTFTDVDLAGRYEPWRGPRFFNIRIYRDSTPLRLDFQYALTGARGTVVASGAARVYEAYYQYYDYNVGSRAGLNSNPACYETQALQHWLDQLIRHAPPQRRTMTGVPTRAAS
jgi:Protein of unknown function (DUF3016)